MSKALKDGRRKITENWLFCQHFIRRFTESRPARPFRFPSFTRQRRLGGLGLDGRANLLYFFLASSSRSDIQYDLMKWLKLQMFEDSKVTRINRYTAAVTWAGSE